MHQNFIEKVGFKSQDEESQNIQETSSLNHQSDQQIEQKYENKCEKSENKTEKQFRIHVQSML